MKLKLGSLKVKLGIAALALVTVFGGGLVLAVNVYGMGPSHRVHQAGCSVTLLTVPAPVRSMLYDGNNVPKAFHYTKKVSADAGYAGDYVRAYQAAKLDPKTVTLAPFEKGKAGAHAVYVDKSSSCSNIYIAVSHGPFQAVVYKKK